MQRLLLAIDGSAHTAAALDLLQRLPLPADCELILLCVVETPDPSHALVSAGPDATQVFDDLRLTLRGEAEELLSQCALQIESKAWSVTTEIREGVPAEQITEAASELDVDLLVLGSLGCTGHGRFLLGGVSKRVLHEFGCSVLVVRPPANAEPNGNGSQDVLRLLLAYDGSPNSQAAVQSLASLPLGEHVELTVLTVLTVATKLFRKDIAERLSEEWQHYKAQAQQQQEDVSEQLRPTKAQITMRLMDGGVDASDELLNAAELLSTDIVVLGHSCATRLERLLVGSLPSRLVEYAPCSVWVVRA